MNNIISMFISSRWMCPEEHKHVLCALLGLFCLQEMSCVTDLKSISTHLSITQVISLLVGAVRISSEVKLIVICVNIMLASPSFILKYKLNTAYSVI